MPTAIAKLRIVLESDGLHIAYDVAQCRNLDASVNTTSIVESVESQRCSHLHFINTTSIVESVEPQHCSINCSVNTTSICAANSVNEELFRVDLSVQQLLSHIR